VHHFREFSGLANGQFSMVSPADGCHIRHGCGVRFCILAGRKNGEEIMKYTGVIFSTALALVSVQTHANVIISSSNESNHTTALTSAASAVPVSVTGKPFGFVTCGKNSTSARSLGCQDWNAEGAPVIPYTAWPGYRLGALLPASYRITTVSFDSYNGIATIYFEY